VRDGSRTRGGFGRARGGRAPHFHRNAELFHRVQFTDYDLLHGLGRDGFDVRAIGELRVGHDGGRVGVHENDAVTLFPEGFAGLRAGIVELARLAYDDRSGADDEDGVDVGSSGHVAEFAIYDLRVAVEQRAAIGCSGGAR
jgi:hypothetical protein